MDEDPGMDRQGIMGWSLLKLKQKIYQIQPNTSRKAKSNPSAKDLNNNELKCTNRNQAVNNLR